MIGDTSHCSVISPNSNLVAPQDIRIKTSGGVCAITLARWPKRNAISREMALRAASAITHAQERHDTRGILITADGAHFSAGADLAEALPDRDRGVYERHTGTQPVFDLIKTIAHSRIPVVTAISGHCLGGAVGIIAASALAVADQTARFGLPETRMGVFPAAIVAHVAERVGRTRAFRWGVLGDTIDADEAYAWGLIDVLVDCDATGTARALLERLCDTAAQRMTRAAMEWRSGVQEAGPLGESVRLGTLLAEIYADPHRPHSPPAETKDHG